MFSADSGLFNSFFALMSDVGKGITADRCCQGHWKLMVVRHLLRICIPIPLDFYSPAELEFGQLFNLFRAKDILCSYLIALQIGVFELAVKSAFALRACIADFPRCHVPSRIGRWRLHGSLSIGINLLCQQLQIF